MLLVFNKYGHFEMSLAERPEILNKDYFMLESEELIGFMWSDGTEIFSAETSAPSKYHIIKDGEWFLPPNRAAEILSEAKTEKIISLNAAAQAFVDSHSGASQVPDFELATWPLQSTEAQAWAADKSATTPILDGIAAARGLDKDKLKAAALKKALAYSALSAIVAGQRQAIQDQIEAAKTKSALDKIKIEFKLPEAV